MSEQWWRPEGASSVEQLLAPGVDPQKDLGIGLLALHRAGAEACELVAKTAVADEVVLITALAETRAVVAPKAVHTIAKSAGGPQYAGLLLRDVLDDAESAALSLYRSCLAKSVSPPVAAQRVGMVYGVPAREMGRYSALATDPKAPLVAVQDLADRTLLGYVSKVVQEEYQPLPEDIVKAVSDSAYLDEKNVVNGPGGRFVRESTAVKPATQTASLQAMFDQAEQRVAAEEAAEPSGTVGSTRQPRKVRQVRRVRQVRQIAEEVETKRQVRSASMSASLATGMKADLSATAMRAQKLAASVQRADAPLPLGGIRDRKPGDVLKRRGKTKIDGQLGTSVSFVLPANEYLSLGRAAASGQGGSHLVRAGALEEYAGKAREAKHEDHVSGVEHVLDIMKESAGGDRETLYAEIPMAKLEATGDAEHALKEAKLEFLRRKAEGLKARGININPATQVGNVDAAPDIKRPEVMILAYRPPRRTDDGRLEEGGRTEHVVEILVDPTVKGSQDMEGRITLDDDQGIAMATLFRPTAEGEPLQRLTFFDLRLRAMRTIVLAKATSAEEVDGHISKAVSESAYLDRHNVVNGPGGRFAPEGTRSLQELFDQAAAREKEPVRMARVRPVRQVRQVRSVSAARTADRPAAAMTASVQAKPLHAELPARLSEAQMKAIIKPMTRSKAEMAEADPNNPMRGMIDFTAPGLYDAVPPNLMERLVNILNPDPSRWRLPEDTSEAIDLRHRGQARDILRYRTPTSGADAENLLGHQAIGYWNLQRQRNTSARNLNEADKPIAGGLVDDADQLQDLARSLMDKMAQDSSLSTFRVHVRPQSKGGARVTVYANSEVLPKLHLVRYSEGADVDPERLVPEGEMKRLHNLTSLTNALELAYWQHTQTIDTGNDPEIANPYVKVWRVE